MPAPDDEAEGAAHRSHLFIGHISLSRPTASSETRKLTARLGLSNAVLVWNAETGSHR